MLIIQWGVMSNEVWGVMSEWGRMIRWGEKLGEESSLYRQKWGILAPWWTHNTGGWHHTEESRKKWNKRKNRVVFICKKNLILMRNEFFHMHETIGLRKEQTNMNMKEERNSKWKWIQKYNIKGIQSTTWIRKGIQNKQKINNDTNTLERGLLSLPGVSINENRIE